MITKIKEKEILDLYNQGLGIYQIANRIGSSQPTVGKVLIKNGIDYKEDLKKFKEEQLEKAVLFYSQGKSQIFIEKELGLTRKTIRELLKTTDQTYRSKSEQLLIHRKNDVRPDAFDDLTNEETAYWIGFFHADGHLRNLGGEISIELQRGDKGHLEKFKKFLNCSNKIKDRVDKKGHELSQIKVGCKSLHNRLKQYGYTNKKSSDASVPEELKYNKHFWRGVIDGDGGVYDYKHLYSKVVFLCGNLNTVLGFINFISKELNIEPKIPSTHTSIFQIHYYKEAIQIYNLLYSSSTVHLDRKYEIFKNLEK